MWNQTLKQDLKRGRTTEFSLYNMRTAVYRPFAKSNLYFDRVMNEAVYVFPSILPTLGIEKGNRALCIAGIGDRKGFGCLATNMVPAPDLALERAPCFPLYTYAEDGSNRQENITDWTP